MPKFAGETLKFSRVARLFVVKGFPRGANQLLMLVLLQNGGWASSCSSGHLGLKLEGLAVTLGRNGETGAYGLVG